MKAISLFLAVTICTFFSGCGSRNVRSTKLVTGVYCGECVGGTCAPILIVTETESGIDTSNDFFFLDQTKIFEPEKICLLSDSLHKELKKLLSEIPPSFNSLPEKVGCPDCTDQCGYYISNGKHFSRIDPLKCSEEIKVFMEKVKVATEISLRELKRNK
jgi:hypothetical protein